MSYGRPDNVKSLQSLLKSNYTGKWFIVIGDDDPKMEAYKSAFGDKCIVFNKGDYIAKSDRMGLKITKVIMFARNACFDIAESLGLKYFQQFDDDYTGFFFPFTESLKYLTSRPRIKSYDRAVQAMIDFYITTPEKCAAISFAQGGDFIGGDDPESRWGFKSLRKCMNSWLCSTDRRFIFRGCMNEDVSAYTLMQSQGMLCLNIMQIRMEQPLTQTTGGMSEVYKQYGTHAKSFLTVMLNPSFVKIGVIQHKQQRLHHKINWNRCAAKIIRETHKKHQNHENKNSNALA
jgi:hypothetical protein